MFTARIKSIDKYRHQASNRDLIDVTFEVVDREGDVVATKRRTFDPLTTKDEIKEAAQKLADSYAHDVNTGKRNAENEKRNRNVDELKNALEGEEITSEVEVEDAEVEETDDETN